MGVYKLIQITHKDGCITIEGHAGYAPAGQDIVCAAVSALVACFLASIEELTADKIKSTENEQGQIQTIEYKTLSAPGQVLLGSFFVGIRMIADSYPANVRFAQACTA